MTIPPLLVFASILGALLLIGGLIHAVTRLGVRVDALEDRQPQATNPREVADALKRRILRELE